jgi:hypothetical protein
MKGFPAVGYGPILALCAENRLLGQAGVLKQVCHGGFPQLHDAKSA